MLQLLPKLASGVFEKIDENIKGATVSIPQGNETVFSAGLQGRTSQAHIRSHNDILTIYDEQRLRERTLISNTKELASMSGSRRNTARGQNITRNIKNNKQLLLQIAVKVLA